MSQSFFRNVLKNKAMQVHIAAIPAMRAAWVFNVSDIANALLKSAELVLETELSVSCACAERCQVQAPNAPKMPPTIENI